MLDCLINYIGLNYCLTGAYDAPDSGLYLNSLPGISMESMENIADKEQKDFEGVWADVQSVATSRFKIAVMTELNKCFSLKSDCDYEDMICTNKEKLVQAWMYLLGNQLMLERLYSTRLNRFTTVDREQAAELRDHYQVEFEKHLELSVRLMDVTGCEFCCQTNPHSVYWLP